MGVAAGRLRLRYFERTYPVMAREGRLTQQREPGQAWVDLSATSTTELIAKLRAAAVEEHALRAAGDIDAATNRSDAQTAIFAELRGRPEYAHILADLLEIGSDVERALRYDAATELGGAPKIRALERLRDEQVEPFATNAASAT